jgi:ABC-type transporter Mla subunit MlaD
MIIAQPARRSTALQSSTSIDQSASSSNQLAARFNAFYQEFRQTTATVAQHTIQLATAVSQFNDFQSTTKQELESIRDNIQLSTASTISTQQRLDQTQHEIQQSLQQITQFLISNHNQPIQHQPSAPLSSTIQRSSTLRQPTYSQPYNSYRLSHQPPQPDSAPESAQNLTNQSDECE